MLHFSQLGKVWIAVESTGVAPVDAAGATNAVAESCLPPAMQPKQQCFTQCPGFVQFWGMTSTWLSSFCTTTQPLQQVGIALVATMHRHAA